jgi:methylated-DNA-[protein]-cysteine S-methyltransferase
MCSDIAVKRISGSEPSMERLEHTVVFPSSLGWMSLVADERFVRRLSFGHETPQEALADVGGSADPVDDAGESDCRLSLRERTSFRGAKGDFAPLVRRLQEYADGNEDDFLDVEVDSSDLTAFQRRVVNLCRRIPFGSSLTYGELAERAGHPRAARAVGNCMRINRVPLIVPCHRVVGSDGAMRGYSAGEGIRMKLRLLEMESAAAVC